MLQRVTRDVIISEIMQSLRRIFKTIQDYSHEVFSRFGITGPQLWVLNTLYQNGSLSLGNLSRRMYLHPSTITGMIDRLEKKGYVSRDRNQKDRRVVQVDLTPKGRRLVKKTPSPVQGKMIYGLRKLGKGELQPIYHSLQTLVEMMEAQHIKVTLFFDQEEDR